MYRIILSKQADKTLRKLPRNVADQIQGKLIDLARNPHAPNNNVTAMQGRPGFRLRVGDWRVIYEVEDDVLRIYVFRIAPRGEVYR